MRAHIGQYRIEAALGRGGMGVVYRGVHQNLGREVAVKALAPELTQQPEFKERFFSEAKTQARLQHPNIVGVYDLLEDGGEYFIVMEFVSGRGLDERLRDLAGRMMDLGEAIAIFSQMLAALDYAHSEGVIHRDIKPSNVLITASGRVKLTDFGIALLVGDKRLTMSQTVIGTPTYMSPEQIVRPRSVDHRADIYSAAVVFFEMLAGRPPFDDETEYGIKKRHVETPPPDLAGLRGDLPPGIAQAVAIALGKNPEERYPTAGAFLHALQAAAPQLAIPAAATPPPSQPAYHPTALLSGSTPLPVSPTTWPSAAQTPSGTALYPGAPPAAIPPPAIPLAAIPPAAIPPAAASPAVRQTAGKNRWIVLGAAALLILALGVGGVLFLLRRGPEPGAAEAGSPSQPAALARVSSPPPQPAPAAAPDASQTQQPSDPASSAPAQTAQPLPPERPAQRTEEARTTASSMPPPSRKKQETSATAGSAPAPSQPEPAAAPAPAPAPEKEQPAPAPSESGAALDPFNEMDEVIVSIEDLSKKAMKSYEDADLETPMGPRLEAFTEGAVALRREFRTATGTGVRGTFGTLKESLRRRGGGREVDTRKLEIKVKELRRLSGDVEGLIGGDPGKETVEDYWREIRRHLKRLEGFFP